MNNSTPSPDQRRLLKIPSLNVVHVCGTVANSPTSIPSGATPVGALFDLTVRTYERGKRSTAVRFTVVCRGGLAGTILSRIHRGDVVLVTGALHNHPAATSSLQVTASAVQFLSADDVSSAS